MESIQNYEIYAYKQNATAVAGSDWKKVRANLENYSFTLTNSSLFRLVVLNPCGYQWQLR